MSIQKVQIIVQIIGSVALLVTLIINYRQLRTMGDQLEAMRRSTTVQHILSLLSFIDSDEVRAAEMIVHTKLHRKPLSEWTESERQAASKLCAAFGAAGAVLRSGIIPIGPLLEGWEPILRRSSQILVPFVREMQKPENGGPEYWSGFDWIYNQLDNVKARTRNGQDSRRAGRGSDPEAKGKYKTAEGRYDG